MAKIALMKCDRCCKEEKVPHDKLWGDILPVKIFKCKWDKLEIREEESYSTIYYLCGDCRKSFNKWMKNNKEI